MLNDLKIDVENVKYNYMFILLKINMSFLFVCVSLNILLNIFNQNKYLCSDLH